MKVARISNSIPGSGQTDGFARPVDSPTGQAADCAMRGRPLPPEGKMRHGNRPQWPASPVGAADERIRTGGFARICRQAGRGRTQRRDRAARAACEHPACRRRSGGDRRCCRRRLDRQRHRAHPAATRRDNADGYRQAMDMKREQRRRGHPAHRQPGVHLAPAGRHRQVPRLRADARGDRRERRGDRHRRDPPHQHRPERGRAQPARGAAAGPVHAPAEHRRLLHRRRRGAHPAARARAARRPRAGEARGARRPAHAVSRTCRETLEAAKTLVEDGFEVMVYCSDDPILAQQARGDRLRRGHAARLADRLGHGHPQPVEPAAHPRAGERAGDRRRRRRHRVGCGDRDGARLRRRADEHRDRRRPRSGHDGRRDAAGRRGRPRLAWRAGRMPKKTYSAAPSSPAKACCPVSRPAADGERSDGAASAAMSCADPISRPPNATPTSG